MDLVESANQNLFPASYQSKNILTPEFTSENIAYSSVSDVKSSIEYDSFKTDMAQNIIKCEPVTDPDVTQLDIVYDQPQSSNRQGQNMRKRHLIIENDDELDISMICDTIYL